MIIRLFLHSVEATWNRVPIWKSICDVDLKPIESINIVHMSRITKREPFLVIIVLTFIILITMLHYLTIQDKVKVHVIYRELYFLPIILAAFWFGLYGGLTAALVVTMLYLPMVIGKSSGLAEHDLGNLLEILLFNIIGILVGWLRKREAILQENRRKEEELAVMGRAVACVAHDMKTPLIAIGGFVRQIRRKLPRNNRAGQKLDIVIHQTERLESMVKGMLAFARPLELKRRGDDLNKLFNEIIPIAEEKARKHNVQLSFHLQRETLICPCDVGYLQQALLNLVNNAVEASPSGEIVIVRTMNNSGHTYIEVEDSGEGIPCDQIDNYLQPFISNKKEGTGLGLPIVKKIVEAHGGTLQCARRRINGMVFRIILPTSTDDKSVIFDSRAKVPKNLG
jgi:two-component system sensor histidine kinase HydH